MVRDELLHILETNRGAFLSGSDLAARLGVSRTAIWKAIVALREHGLQIETAPRVGYRLTPQDDSLQEAGVTALLRTKAFGRALLVLPSVPSTNTLMKEQYARSSPSGFTIVAGEQTAGRGRLGRTFCSPDGGVYLSVLLHPPALPITRLNLLTIAAAVAVCRAIRDTCEFSPQVKWVNDILMDGKKLCGILTEASIEGETGALSFAVIGIGINLRLDRTALPDDVQEIAGGLSDFCENPPRRAALAAAVLNQLEICCEMLFSDDCAALLDEYRRHLCILDRPIEVLEGDGRYRATAEAIDDNGHLLIRLPNGKQQTLAAGEISIRF